jgi:hypothetical protein
MVTDVVQIVQPGDFEAERHFYPRVLNAQAHPLVRYFGTLNREQIVHRYCHLHPHARPEDIRSILETTTRHFRWGGADLLHCTDEDGVRHMVVIETNSSPSGQKSMTIRDEARESERYELLLRNSFLPMLKRRKLPEGGLAVLYDKNLMENSGYAAALATLTGEPVALVPWYLNDPDPPARFNQEQILEVRWPDGEWKPIRAAFRYVTQKPWNRIPPITRTAIFNPTLACLAGGRNKMLAAKAYDFYNAGKEDEGLRIQTPETFWDVAKGEVPFWVERLGGFAVVKVPYSNAGQGVFTITCPEELAAFMDQEFEYNRFIVQSLIGNVGWSSRSSLGRLYHVGTVPNKKGQIFVADIRFMVGNGPEGFYPIGMYARRARSPLTKTANEGTSSWDMLGTNLSVKKTDGGWDSESDRLLLMDARDFNRLGLGMDEIIDSYLQTVMSVIAIDDMAKSLVTQKKTFRRRFFRSINPDARLVEEICRHKEVV